MRAREENTPIIYDYDAKQASTLLLTGKSVGSWLIRNSKAAPGLLTISVLDSENTVLHMRFGLTDKGWEAAPGALDELQAFTRKSNELFMRDGFAQQHADRALVVMVNAYQDNHNTQAQLSLTKLIMPDPDQATRLHGYSSYCNDIRNHALETIGDLVRPTIPRK